MTTSTPNLALVLYNSTTDSAEYFSNFRAVIAGTSLTSNFYKIDTAYGSMQAEIDVIQAGAYFTLASFISSNYYEATVTGITSYATGMKIILSLDTASAGTVTLNINSLGIKSVMKIDATGTPVNISAGELMVGKYYFFAYDGTRWVWVEANSADQIYIPGTSGNVVTVGSGNTLSGETSQSTMISQTINSATTKTTLVDSDKLGLVDSEDSNILKGITWSSIKTMIGTVLGAIVNSIASKTNPVGADFIFIGDSESSNATKKLLLSNAYKSLGTGTPTSSTALLGDGSWGSIASSDVVGKKRLSLESSVPVSTTNQTAKTSVYWTDGTTNLSVSVPSTTNTPFDIFYSLSLNTLSAVSWTNDTTRATALVYDLGALVKSGDTDKLYLGTGRTTGTSGQCEISFGGSGSGGVEAKLYLWNNYNRVDFYGQSLESTSSWTYASTTIRPYNNSTGNRISLVVGVREDSVSINALSICKGQNGVVGAATGIGVDSTNSLSGLRGVNGSSEQIGVSSSHKTTLSAGYHYIQLVEACSTAGTCTFYGSPSTFYSSGISVGFKM